VQGQGKSLAGSQPMQIVDTAGYPVEVSSGVPDLDDSDESCTIKEFRIRWPSSVVASQPNSVAILTSQA
jgi:hypothetical protein